MGIVDDLARMAELLGVRVRRADLEQDAPQIQALLADQETLLALPIDGREPAWGPALPRGHPWGRGID